MYNVLWIDDEWGKQSVFIKLCLKKHNIKVVPFEFVPDGLKALEADFSNWDAVLLDAKVKMSENDTPNLEGLQVAVKKIEKLAERRPLPYFISTGQPDLSSADYFKQIYGNFYIKDTDDDRLMEDIVSKIEECATPEFKLRNQYSEEFSAANLLPGASDLLMHSLLQEFEGSSVEDMKYLFNPLRGVVEQMVSELQKCGFLPKVSLNAIPRLLLREGVFEEGYALQKSFMPAALANSFEYFLEVTQDGSHKKYDLNLHVFEYVLKRRSANLYRSVLYIAMDLLLWFKDCIISGPIPNNIIQKYIYKGIVSSYIPEGKSLPVLYCGKYQLGKKEGLAPGVEVGIIKSVESQFPYENITQYCRQSEYEILDSTQKSINEEK